MHFCSSFAAAMFGPVEGVGHERDGAGVNCGYGFGKSTRQSLIADAQALWRTLQMRPDLIEARGGLTDSERALLEGVAFASYPSMFTSERP